MTNELIDFYLTFLLSQTQKKAYAFPPFFSQTLLEKNAKNQFAIRPKQVIQTYTRVFPAWNFYVAQKAEVILFPLLVDQVNDQNHWLLFKYEKRSNILELYDNNWFMQTSRERVDYQKIFK